MLGSPELIRFQNFRLGRNKEQLRRTLTHQQRQNAGGAYYERTFKATKLLYQQENENSVNISECLERKQYTSYVTVVLSRDSVIPFYVKKREIKVNLTFIFWN